MAIGLYLMLPLAVLRICLSPFIIIVMIWVILGTIVDDSGQPKYYSRHSAQTD